MSFEAESNSELTVIVPAYQLHFQFPVQNKIHKQKSKKFCRTPGPAYLAVLPVLVIFCPLGPTNFKKSVIIIISWFIYFYIHSWEFIIYIVFFRLINKSFLKPWKVEPDWIKFVFQIPTRVMVFNTTFSNISLIL